MSGVSPGSTSRRVATITTRRVAISQREESQHPQRRHVGEVDVVEHDEEGAAAALGRGAPARTLRKTGKREASLRRGWRARAVRYVEPSSARACIQGNETRARRPIPRPVPRRRETPRSRGFGGGGRRQADLPCRTRRKGSRAPPGPASRPPATHERRELAFAPDHRRGHPIRIITSYRPRRGPRHGVTPNVTHPHEGRRRVSRAQREEAACPSVSQNVPNRRGERRWRASGHGDRLGKLRARLHLSPRRPRDPYSARCSSAPPRFARIARGGVPVGAGVRRAAT